jgi:hypothetical protein
VNSREHRRAIREAKGLVNPLDKTIVWKSTQALKKGKTQEWNLLSAYYVVLSWQRKKGYRVEWNHPVPTAPHYQMPVSNVEYRKRINDARRLFAEQVRRHQIDFAARTLGA